MDTLHTILLQPIDIADLFLRFTSAGALFLLLLFYVITPCGKQLWINGFLILCVISYILLTSPIADRHYGYLRPPLLLFTDLTSYALLLFYAQQVGKNVSFGSLPRAGIVVIGLWLAWLVYFFIIEGGNGKFHDVHHLIGLIILVYIVIDAANGYVDDLNQNSRNLRLLLTITITCYMGCLTAFELVLTDIRDTAWFSAINALLLWIITTSVCVLKFREIALTTRQQPYPASHKLQVATDPSADKLLQLMDDGYYTNNGLTIKKLAATLNLPEHQLREMINARLGFNNFSHFLNSYRLSAACKKLQDPTYDKQPILTIALNLGFDSISPFNRSFKAYSGLTPSEYRRQFQNR